MSLREWIIFLKELELTIVSGEYFRAGFGTVYLSVRGIESSRENITQIEDVLFQYRHKLSKRILSRKPQPQNKWQGKWLNIHDLLSEEG
jgi:hypothetical protein